jgi:putative transposase
MSRKTPSSAEIAARLLRVQTMVAKGLSIAEAIKEVGVDEPTYQKWQDDYGGLLRLLGSSPPPRQKRRSKKQTV